MTTAYSSLLGLALPVQGELAGQWGDTVNDYITKYLDASIAGSLSITADVTLTKTTGTTLGAASSQYAILTCSPSSVNIVVTAPAAYKIYVVNNTSASYTVTIRGATPTSGVVLAALEKAVVAWNGSDFFKVATSATDGVSTFSAGSTGLTPSSATAGAVTLAGTLAVANGGTGLTAGTSGGVLAYTAAGTLASSSALAASALVIGGGAGAAPSTTTTGTGVVTALGVNTGSAGAFVVNGGALGTPASGTVTNLTGTASININGTVGATTATTGAFTTVSATTSIITKKNGSDTVGSGGALGLANAAEDREWLLQLSGSNELWYWAYDSTASPAWVNPGRMTRTGLNSTVIGATTPAAGSFTTLTATGTSTLAAINASGTITGTNGVRMLNLLGSTGANQLAHISSNGTDAYIGLASSTGGSLITGSPAYSLEFRNDTGFAWGLGTPKVAQLDSTGLAVTGSVSATVGTITSSTLPSGTWAGTIYNATNAIASNGLRVANVYRDTTSTAFEVGSVFGAGAFTYIPYLKIDGLGTSTFSPDGSTRAIISSTGLAVTGALSASGQSSFGGVLQITGAGVPASGGGMELSGSASDSSITSFNRSLGTYLAQYFNALQYSFATSGTERMRLTSTGLAVTNLLDLSGAAAGQIQFPATQNASSNANTLDDYEEASWTPVLSDAVTGGNTATFTNNSSVTKIGRQVTVRCYANSIVTSGMTAGNRLFIQSLPYVVSGNAAGSFYTYRVSRNAATVSSAISAFETTTSAGLNLFTTSSATTDIGILVSDIVSGTSEIVFTLTYFTT